MNFSSNDFAISVVLLGLLGYQSDAFDRVADKDLRLLLAIQNITVSQPEDPFSSVIDAGSARDRCDRQRLRIVDESGSRHRAVGRSRSDEHIHVIYGNELLVCSQPIWSGYFGILVNEFDRMPEVMLFVSLHCVDDILPKTGPVTGEDCGDADGDACFWSVS